MEMAALEANEVVLSLVLQEVLLHNTMAQIHHQCTIYTKIIYYFMLYNMEMEISYKYQYYTCGQKAYGVIVILQYNMNRRCVWTVSRYMCSNK